MPRSSEPELLDWVYDRRFPEKRGRFQEWFFQDGLRFALVCIPRAVRKPGEQFTYKIPDEFLIIEEDKETRAREKEARELK